MKRKDFIIKPILNTKCDTCGFSNSVCRCNENIATAEALAILMGLDPAGVVNIEVSPRDYEAIRAAMDKK